jgi:vitamin B12 transporter
VAETIVTGTRSWDAVPIDEIGGSVTLLDAQALERIENLFNENYEQVFSFTNPGRTAYAGLRACF